MRWWIALGIGIAAIALLFYFGDRPYERIEDRVASLRTEQEVIDRFGKPTQVAMAGEADYYVPGYAYKERAISNRVLIYFPSNLAFPGHDIILYVYIDKDGRVEDYFVGGS